MQVRRDLVAAKPAALVASIPAALAAAAVGVAILDDGGFSARPRLLFAGVAGAALVAAPVGDRAAALRLARSPVVVVLFALAALGAGSAAWTVGSAAESLRWAAVTAGYAAVAVAAGVAVGRRGPVPVAALVCVLAGAAAAVGLASAASFELPYAERIGGTWRPGGHFEYPPALALAQVSALPALLSAMCSRRSWLAALAALAAAAAAAVLALADSRAELVFAACVAGAALALPGRSAGARRTELGAALALLAGAGLAAHAAAGGFVAARDTAPGAWRAIGVALVCASVPLCWLGVRRLLARTAARGRSARWSHRRAAASVAVMGALALAIGSAAFARPPGRAVEASGGFAHGRTQTWRAAVEVWRDRPLAGAGADSFVIASARHQRGAGVRFAHQLPLELGAELGAGGFALAVALYVAALLAVWRARRERAAWLLGPAVVAFLAANLVDWPWHLAGSGALFAVALGGVLAAPRGARGRVDPRGA